MKKISILFICFIISIISADAAKPPTLPISYNSTSLSAKSVAMGGAGVAVPGSIDGIFYNPAALGYNESKQLQAEIAFSVKRDSDIDENKLNLIDPVGVGFNSVAVLQENGAVSWRTLSSYKINSSDTSGWYKKEESIKAVTISAANLTENGSSAGINISYLYGTLAESYLKNGTPFAQTCSGNGFSIDIGFMQPLSKQLYCGINFENIIGFMWWGNYDYDQLPFGIRAGLCYYAGTFSFAADYSKKFYRFGEYKDNLVSAGIEQYLSNAFCIRLGVQGDSIDEDTVKITYGCGLNISILSLSVAGENYKEDKEDISKYYFSLKVLM